MSTVKGTKLPSIKPWRPSKSQASSRQGAVENAERQLTKPYGGDPLDIGKPPRVPPPVPGGGPAPVDDSDERRDAATRWLEQRRSSRGETPVADRRRRLEQFPHDICAGRRREGVDRRRVYVHR